jgi:hypothetical protein
MSKNGLSLGNIITLKPFLTGGTVPLGVGCLTTLNLLRSVRSTTLGEDYLRIKDDILFQLKETKEYNSNTSWTAVVLLSWPLVRLFMEPVF